VLSVVYSAALAGKSTQGKESATSWLPNSVVDGNAAASARGGARGKHAGAEHNVHPGKHCASERAVLCVIVSRQGARKYSVGDVHAIGSEAAADRLEGSSVLSKQAAVRVIGLGAQLCTLSR
jgi:hypothetical protein